MQTQTHIKNPWFGLRFTKRRRTIFQSTSRWSWYSRLRGGRHVQIWKPIRTTSIIWSWWRCVQKSLFLRQN